MKIIKSKIKEIKVKHSKGKAEMISKQTMDRNGEAQNINSLHPPKPLTTGQKRNTERC